MCAPESAARHPALAEIYRRAFLTTALAATVATSEIPRRLRGVDTTYQSVNRPTRASSETSILDLAASDCPVDTVVVVMMENCSFDHYLGWLGDDDEYLDAGRRRYGPNFRIDARVPQTYRDGGGQLVATRSAGSHKRDKVETAVAPCVIRGTAGKSRASKTTRASSLPERRATVLRSRTTSPPISRCTAAREPAMQDSAARCASAVRDDCAPTTYTGRLRVGDHSYEITQADLTTVGLDAYIEPTGALHVGSGTLGSLAKNARERSRRSPATACASVTAPVPTQQQSKAHPSLHPAHFTDASNETVLVFRAPDEFKPTKTVKRGLVYLAGSGLVVDPALVPLTYTRPELARLSRAWAPKARDRFASRNAVRAPIQHSSTPLRPRLRPH